MNRIFAILVFAGTIWLSVNGQEEDPLISPVPLVTPEQSSVERDANRRMWQKTAADNALRSGLASIAVGLYDRLLEQGALDAEQITEIRLNRISALIALGRMEEADRSLEDFGPDTSSPFLLRRALVNFFLADADRADSQLKAIVPDNLPDFDLAWYYLLLGLVDRGARNEESDSLLNRARLLAVSPEQRAQVDLIIYRSILLEGRTLEEDQLNRLKNQMDNELSDGKRAGIQFAKEYTIALHKLDRKLDALHVIQQSIPKINEVDYDLRDELLLLSGIISGEDSTKGREALRELVSRGVTTDLRMRALQELVSSSDTPLEIETFLKF
ncbi:MAG: hypothetical protein KJT03_20885, partial [Verrucomicrobiae bacterium]|nr:hypothetical protein [Verrucomicrobiae bacterium]